MISVIIPCYNMEMYVTKSVESILKQTYNDIEIILINDGSKDNTFKVCQELSLNNSKISVINQSNQGVSVARNKGIELSKGEYICFLDGDDFLDETCFEKVIEKFQNNHDIDMCFYGFRDVSESGEISGEYHTFRIYPDNIINGTEALMLKCMRKIWICTGACVYKKELLNKYKIRYKEGYKYGEDVNFINTCISYAKKIDCVKENFLNCLKRNGSATRSGLNPFFIQGSELNRELYKDIKKRENISESDRKKMLLASDIDYIDLTSAAGKNIVENIGFFSFCKANKLYKEFNIFHENIQLDKIKSHLSRAKKLEWNLFCRHKILFFYTVKFYRMIKR